MSNIKLYNDNCMDIFPTMEDDSVTLTLTDIPYDEVNRKSGGLRNLDKSHADIITFSLNDFIDETPDDEIYAIPPDGAVGVPMQSWECNYCQYKLICKGS